jgi:hypothetical protein
VNRWRLPAPAAGADATGVAVDGAGAAVAVAPAVTVTVTAITQGGKDSKDIELFNEYQREQTHGRGKRHP